MKHIMTLAVATVVGMSAFAMPAQASHWRQDMQIIESFYPKYLHRNPDGAGLDYWRRELRRRSLLEIESMFLASPEYYHVHGCTPEGFINGLLNDVLGRPACAHDIQRWLTRLHHCGCRQTVAREVLSMAIADRQQPVIVNPPVQVFRPGPQVIVPGRGHGHGLGNGNHGLHNHGRVNPQQPIVVPPRGRNFQQPRSGFQIRLNFGR